MKKIMMILIGLLMISNAFAVYNNLSEWTLDDNNYDGLVNESKEIIDSISGNNGTLYGKTFYHGTNNGATINQVGKVIKHIVLEVVIISIVVISPS